jgi:hypothetical protein
MYLKDFIVKNQFGFDAGFVVQIVKKTRELEVPKGQIFVRRTEAWKKEADVTDLMDLMNLSIIYYQTRLEIYSNDNRLIAAVDALAEFIGNTKIAYGTLD